MRRLMIAAALVATSTAAVAAVANLNKFQDKAPEVVQINVLSVDQQSARREFEDFKGQKVVEVTASVTASARVQAVVRSATGLAPGNVITIRYQIGYRTPPVPGPQQPRMLKQGEIVKAYLSGSAGTYAPAALSMSFVAP